MIIKIVVQYAKEKHQNLMPETKMLSVAFSYCNPH